MGHREHRAQRVRKPTPGVLCALCGSSELLYAIEQLIVIAFLDHVVPLLLPNIFRYLFDTLVLL
jgi:hypothetical protein